MELSYYGNYSAFCKKEEMELSDYENYSARCEREKMTLFIRKYFPKIECMVERWLMGLDCITLKKMVERWLREEYHRTLNEDIYRALCFLEKDEEQINREERERIKYMIYMLLLAIFLGNNDKCKFLATPDRLKISCITVYLLGNDGAHTYNGNGILLTTRRKYTRFKDEELLDEIRPANIPLDVLQRQPTDKEIARLSGRIGQEYRLLAYELGLTRVQLDHLTLDCPTTLLRIERMFFIWRDEMEGNSTFEILVNAMGMHGINTDIVNQSLERA